MSQESRVKSPEFRVDRPQSRLDSRLSTLDSRLVASLLSLSLVAPTPAAAPISFPRDHGSHVDAALEWWYWTGHLTSEEGRAYGFQLTFFRARDLHLAHFAWSDLAAAKFTFHEKTHLGLPGIPGDPTVPMLPFERS